MKPFVFKFIVGLGFIATSLQTQAQSLICEGAESHDIAWHFNNNQIRTLQSNKTEPRNVGVSTSEKIRRVESRVKAYHSSVNGVSASKIAETIVWAAECTGNDFTYFAALLEVESNLCKDRHNRGGGDSGCGQFTSAAINEFKNQMKLPGQQANNNAVKQVTDSLHQMARTCFSNAGDSKRYDDFIALYSGSRSHIQNTLRAGHHLDLDILGAAMYLKIMVGLAGGYTVPGNAAGGIARYNGGGDRNYVSKVTSKVQNVDFICYEDHYTPDVQSVSCELSNDSQRCEHEVSGGITI